MKDCQKVYIKGDPNRGAEVIKALTDLGGRNIHSHTGASKDTYYYINPNGVINVAAPNGEVCYPFLKEFYKEISLERWKPEYNGCFYLINTTGEIIERIWVNSQFDKLSLEFGNCFRTKEEAEATRDKIKKMLNNKA